MNKAICIKDLLIFKLGEKYNYEIIYFHIENMPGDHLTYYVYYEDPALMFRRFSTYQFECFFITQADWRDSQINEILK